jgi:hypothetical protein
VSDNRVLVGSNTWAISVVVELDELGSPPKEHRCRDADNRFTVVTRVWDQVSIGPREVLGQLNARVRSAISPSPMMRWITSRAGNNRISSEDLDCPGTM